MRYINILAGFVGLVLAAGRTSPPEGALVVAADGSGKYKTIQDAVDALSSSSSEQSIFVRHGLLLLNALVIADDASLADQARHLQGAGIREAAQWTSRHLRPHIGHVFIRRQPSRHYWQQEPENCSSAIACCFPAISLITFDVQEANNDATATLRVWTSNFKLYNVNVVNTFGKGSQALALSANAGVCRSMFLIIFKSDISQDQGYYGCSFKGFQDTVLAQTGAQLYAKSYIEGATDFIFGQNGQAWFDYCDIRVLSASVGYITASGRADAANPSHYVLNKCSISAAGGKSVEAGAYFLGRPWGAYARVAVQFCTMSNVINAAGWAVWNKGDERTGKVEFGEYGNEGAGASGTRAKFAKKLDAPVKKESVLGSGYASASWVDKAYLS